MNCQPAFCLRLPPGLIAFVATALLCSSAVQAAPLSLRHQLAKRTGHEASAAAPWLWYVRMHEIGNLQVGMANFGGIGWGGLNCEDEFKAGIHFPKGSSNAFLGADIWVGGVVDRDTLVSVTWDPDWITGHGWTQEFHTAPWPNGTFEERTTREQLTLGSQCNTIYYSDDAVSEHDLITTAWDTTTDAQYTSTNRFDGRPHMPMGLELSQRSYSWAYEYARDFVLIEYKIKNIGMMQHGRYHAAHVEDLYVGLLSWGGVYFDNRGSGNDSMFEVRDDLVGYMRTAPLPGHPDLVDTLDLAWVTDNDGDPRNGDYGAESIPNAFGLRLLEPPAPGLVRTFNWWVGHRNPAFDWGPQRRGNELDIPTGGMGWPLTDVAKYQMMTNGEVDYPQMEAAINHEGAGWLPPHANSAWAVDMANGQHGWCLLSFGPLDLPPGDSITFAVAAIGGENLHADAANYATYFDVFNPQIYFERLDFSDLIRNAQWAAWIYDSPGRDTDGDGNAGAYYLVDGDTVYYRGDGVPDFKGPPPPTAPYLDPNGERGQVTLRWNGVRSETDLDPFSNRADFEGYRVYMSRTGRDDDFALLAQRDLVNYSRYTWVAEAQRWRMLDAPMSLDSLHILYDSLSWEQYGHPFHPDSFAVADAGRALMEVHFDPQNPTRVDSIYRYFQPYEANLTADDAALALAVEAGLKIDAVIRRVYPDAAPGDTDRRADGELFAPYYEYEYVVTGLQVAEPVMFAVTAFDHGDPATGVAAQESFPTVNATEVWPIASSTDVEETRPAPGVYPNPYRLLDGYNAAGWENPRGAEPDAERARRMTFYNLPDTCSISIWSLDGDLVKKLEHRAGPASSDATVEVWNLITRNTQAVKTGIYIWSIESRHGTDVGKLVIIK